MQQRPLPPSGSQCTSVVEHASRPFTALGYEARAAAQAHKSGPSIARQAGHTIYILADGSQAQGHGTVVLSINATKSALFHADLLFSTCLFARRGAGGSVPQCAGAAWDGGSLAAS